MPLDIEDVKTRGLGLVGEFKQFIARGSVMDMAVGVIIGGAFKAIVDSLIADIVNPILGAFTGGYTALTALAISLPWGGDLLVGNFLNAVLNFFIMALVVHPARNQNLSLAGLSQNCVVVLGGRQPASVLRLVLQKSRSNPNTNF